MMASVRYVKWKGVVTVGWINNPSLESYRQESSWDEAASPSGEQLQEGRKKGKHAASATS
jgi:hypothetical protein